jgi:hypothetical protein
MGLCAARLLPCDSSVNFDCCNLQVIRQRHGQAQHADGAVPTVGVFEY